MILNRFHRCIFLAPRQLKRTLVTYRTESDGSIGVITLDNPSKLNALTEPMGDALSEVLATVHKQIPRAVIVTGAGRAFSAGGDLDWLMDRHHDNPTNNEEIMLKFYKRFLILRTLPVPVIAAINGPAIGAGLSLAVGGTDMRVACPKATMGFTFTRLGLHPGMAALHHVPQLVGPAQAADILLSGRVFTAQEAKEMGLVSRLSEDALKGSLELAEEICKAAPVAVQTTLMALRRQSALGLEESMKIDAKSQAETYKTQDLAEGVLSLKEKRSPQFTGK